MIITISGITKDEIKKIDEHAAKHRLSRSAYMIQSSLNRIAQETNIKDYKKKGE